MPRYHVDVLLTTEAMMTIEADSEEEARDKASHGQYEDRDEFQSDVEVFEIRTAK